MAVDEDVSPTKIKEEVETSDDVFKMISKKEFKEKYNVSDYFYLLRDYFQFLPLLKKLNILASMPLPPSSFFP